MRGLGDEQREGTFRAGRERRVAGVSETEKRGGGGSMCQQGGLRHRSGFAPR